MTHLKNKSGYTLIEVTFVVVILSIVAAIAIPRFGGFSTNSRKVEITAKSVVSHLRMTRHLAMAENTPHYLYIDTVADTYAIYSTSVSTLNLIEPVYDLDPGITITGDFTFAFESTGSIVAGTGTSVVFSNGGTDWTLTIVPATGRITREES